MASRYGTDLAGASLFGFTKIRSALLRLHRYPMPTLGVDVVLLFAEPGVTRRVPGLQCKAGVEHRQ